MRISAFSLERWKLGLATRDARLPIRYRHGVRLTLDDGAGHTGQGDATPLEGFSKESLQDAIDDLEAWLRRIQNRGFEVSLHGVASACKGLTSPAARFAAQSSLLETMAAAGHTSVAALLGAEEPPPYARQAMVHGIVDATEAVQHGYPILKLKMGRQRLDQELALASAIRQRHPKVRLRIDANGAWDRQTASRALASLAELDVELAEQPVATDDLEGLAQLRGRGVAIGADESARTMADLEALAERHAADAVVLKPTLVGGIFATLEMAQRAHHLGFRVIVSHTLESDAGHRALCAIAEVLSGKGLWGAGIDTARCFTSATAEVAA